MTLAGGFSGTKAGSNIPCGFRRRIEAPWRDKPSDRDCARAASATRRPWDKVAAPEGAAALETSLYLPVKRFLETLGFQVKGEICGCDVVALHGDGPPVVVVGELKLSFNLDLVLQGVDRTAASDEIWLAV